MKILSFTTFIIAIIFTCCSSSSKLKESRQLLKEYAYCNCFQYATGDTSVFINDVSLSVYFDIANYNFNAYNKIDSLSKSVVGRFKPFEIADYKDKKAVFFNCFNFYKSKQLDSVVRKLDNEIRVNW